LPPRVANRSQTDHSGGWYSARPLYRYIWRTTRSSQIGICLLTAIITPLPMVSLEFQRRIVDDAVGARNVWWLVALGAGYFAVICLRLLLKYVADIAKGRTAETVARDLRLRIMKATQAIWRRRDNDSDDEKVGTAISMLGAETEDMSGFAGDALSLPLLTGGTVIWVVGYLIWIEPLIAAIALVLYIPQLLVVPATQFTINRLARLRIRQLRNLSHLAIHGSSKDSDRRQTPGKLFIDRLYRFRIRIYVRKFFLTEFGNFLDSLGPIVVLVVGGYLAIIGQTQVSTLVVFISGLQRIAEPWDQLITFYRTVSNTGVMYDMVRARLAGTPGEIS
jgi:ABC-type bacteriocin/lantibiotic exporter with double-glycine peptidase domain